MVNESSGERRQITAVFYDIVNSTALLSDWDPEDYEYIQRQIHATAASIIKNFDGHFDRILGDGGCAFFGYPTPAEDAAAAAVSASLEIVHRCQSLQVRELGRPLSVRVGVATGTVVVRKANSDQLPGGANIVGLAPNLAARLQALAEPDTVAVAASTYLLTQWPAPCG